MGTPVKLKIETLPHGPYPAHLLPAAEVLRCEVQTRK